MIIIGLIILYIINAITYINSSVSTEFFMMTTAIFALAFVVAGFVEYWFIARRHFIAMLDDFDGRGNNGD